MDEKDMDDTFGLESCPWCKSDKLAHLRGAFGNLHWVHCRNCRAEGPVAMDWDEAKGLWNNRGEDGEFYCQYCGFLRPDNRDNDKRSYFRRNPNAFISACHICHNKNTKMCINCCNNRSKIN